MDDAASLAVSPQTTSGSEAGLNGGGECGDLPFLIRHNGVWLYQGSPIDRHEMICLFASVLRRDVHGDYWLSTPVESGRIQVEDAPLSIVEMDCRGAGRDQVLSFRTNVDQLICLGPDHDLRVGAGLQADEQFLYIAIQNGDGGYPIEARISRAVYYELAALAVIERIDGEDVPGVWSQSRFFTLTEC